MKTIRIFVLLLFLITGQSILSQSRPNVVIIMTDDMGYGDLGYHGNPQIDTPALDRFAEESIEFTNFYVSPVCAPTRASLMTGRYSTRTGVYDTYSGGAIMATEEITIAEIFQQAQYKTGIFGKWHLGDSYPFRPQDQGFDHSLWHLSGGIGQVGDVFNYYEKDQSYFDPTLYRNGEIVQTKGYCSDVYTDEAIEFVQSNAEAPFFMYLSFNAPHTPLQVPEKYLDKYKNKPIDPQYFKDKGLYVHNMSENDIEAAKKVYAMVDNIDYNVGRLIESLKKNQLYDNTILIFLTDNGPQQNRYTGGFRGRKSMVREGGIHVPFYMKVPPKMSVTDKISTPAAHIDVLPTLAELCGVNLPGQAKIDGLSFAQEIKSKNQIVKRPLFFQWQRSYPEKYRNMAVIYDDYKLIADRDAKSNTDVFELYHLSQDPFETKDLSSENPEKTQELKNKIDLWYQDIMSSDHIAETQRIIIGSDQETHTILNRNDAKGLPLIWDQDDIYVKWDLEIIDQGPYQIKCHFREPLEENGELVVRIGQQHLSKNLTAESTQTIVFDKVHLNPGKVALEGWYYVRWKEHHTPFYVEITKI